MTSQSPDADHVVITMTATGDIAENFSHPVRTIHMSRDNNTLKLGRVSQVQSKGFNATHDNGYFDSPVMSRHHAEITADVDGQAVHITDTGSTHGTFLNDDPERIPSNRPYHLVDGDTLRFGTAIVRKSDTFQPAKLKLGIKFPTKQVAPELRGSSFQAPEFVDDDLYTDDDEYDNDGDVDAEELDKTVAVAIDLTADTDEPEVQPRAYMDLTSPLRSPSFDAEDDEDSSPVVMQSSMTAVPLSTQSNIPVPLSSTTVHLRKVTLEAVSPYEDSIDLESFSEAPTESEDGSSGEESSSEGGPPSEITSEMERLLDNRSEFDDSDDDEEETRPRYGFIVDDDNMEDLDDLDDLDDLEDLQYGQMRLDAAKMPGNLDTIRPKDVSMPSSIPQATPAPVTITGPIHPRSNAYDIASILNPSDRQPSLDSAAGRMSAHTLGAKSGKSEFFEARAENKTNFVPSEAAEQILLPSSAPDSNISTFAPAITTPDVLKQPSNAQEALSTSGPDLVNKDEAKDISAGKSLPTPPQAGQPVDAKADFALAKSPLLDSGERFLATPFHDDHLEDIVDVNEAEDPMQSAAVFQQHKLSFGASDVNKEPTGSRKRKAEKISESDGSKADKPAPLRTATSEPPAKRKATVAAKRKSTTRAVVENLGIAALGGAVVLGSLIFSAPAF